jgi:hypothetical protein
MLQTHELNGSSFAYEFPETLRPHAQRRRSVGVPTCSGTSITLLTPERLQREHAVFSAFI